MRHSHCLCSVSGADVWWYSWSYLSFIAIQLNILQDVNAWLVGDFSGILQGRYELIFPSLPTTLITYMYANQLTLREWVRTSPRVWGTNYRSG